MTGAGTEATLPPRTRAGSGFWRRFRRNRGAVFGLLVLALVLVAVVFGPWLAGNDPWDEHDFGAVEAGGVRVFWKIDCHDPELRGLSADPADPARTVRVLTVMLAEEY